MLRITIIASLATTAILFYSCQKTVTLDLNTAPAQIVIQGEITNTPGPYTISINQSTAFYAENTFPPVSGAVVKISDGQGLTDSLTETSPGIYSTHTLQGTPGNTYSLSVVAQNQQYTASSTMPAPIALDSITWRKGTFQSAIYAIPNFQDPVGVKNYYQFMEYQNGQQLTKDIFVFDDRLSDGKYISLSLRNDSSRLVTGAQLQVKMYTIDANVYNYFNQLEQSLGFNTSASPANPATNISNGAYGYFSAHTVQSKTVTVPSF